MARYLLDTHTVMWWHEEDPRLSSIATETIEDLANEFHVSIVSLWEIVIKLKTEN